MAATDEISRGIITDEAEERREFMFIGHEDVLMRRLEEIQKEIHVKFDAITQETALQWAILSRMIQILAPFAVVSVTSLLARLFGSTFLEGFADTFALGLFLSMIIFDVQPLVKTVKELAALKKDNGTQNDDDIVQEDKPVAADVGAASCEEREV